MFQPSKHSNDRLGTNIHFPAHKQGPRPIGHLAWHFGGDHNIRRHPDSTTLDAAVVAIDSSVLTKCSTLTGGVSSTGLLNELPVHGIHEHIAKGDKLIMHGRTDVWPV